MRNGMGLLALTALTLTTNCASAQDKTVVGPGNVETRKAEVEVLRIVGTEAGPGILEDRPFTGFDWGGKGLLVNTGRKITLFNTDGMGVPFGEKGEGPREYLGPDRILEDPFGRIWVVDRTLRRAVVMGPRDAADQTISLRYPGRGLGVAFLPDGSLVVNGPGSTPENFGKILHTFNPSTESWSSFRPYREDLAFDLGDLGWPHHLSVTPEGNLVTVHPMTYAIEVLDPKNGFSTISRIERKMEGWLEDLEQSTIQGAQGHHVPSVQDVLVDKQGRLFVLSEVGGEGWALWARGQREQFDRAGVDTEGYGEDPPVHALLEVFDLSSGALIDSAALPFSSTWIVGPGVVCNYLGDLPFPRFEVVKVLPPETKPSRGGQR
jgi:hypothetical protein